MFLRKMETLFTKIGTTMGLNVDDIDGKQPKF